MLRFKEGDRVQIVDRAPTPADAKSGLYYGFYRNLSGTVFKLYGNGADAQAAIEVDIATLPEEVAVRHLETRDRMRDSLTGEAKRASAPGGENEFYLRYVILVALTDLKAPQPAKRAVVANGNGKHLQLPPAPPSSPTASASRRRGERPTRPEERNLQTEVPVRNSKRLAA